MSGDERMRHCAACNLDVYNFAGMTRAEIGALLATAEGRVCARLYRRADGTVLTSDCPPGVQARRRGRLRAAVTAALISLSAFASACTTFGKARLRKQASQMTLDVERVATAQQASFAGVVRDESGYPLPGVTVTVRDEATRREFATVTDANGAFAIASLSDGLYRVEVTLSGFSPLVTEHLPLKQGEVARAQVTLRINLIETITVGILVIDPATNSGSGTTFSGERLSKIPIGN